MASTRASRLANRAEKAKRSKEIVKASDRYPNDTDRELPHNAVRTPRTRAIVIDVLSRALSMQRAADEAGVSRTALFKWRNEDPDFDQECLDAIEGGTDRLEDEATRRGERGTRRGVWHKGVRVGYEREYSDNLLGRTLSARRASYRLSNTSVEVTGKGGGPILSANVSLTLEQLRELAAERGLPASVFDE